MSDAGSLGSGNSVNDSSSANSSASVRAYGPTASGNVYNYGSPTTLAGMLGDSTSMIIAAGLAFLVWRGMRHKG